MDVFTPWELASLKFVFHRFDVDHKGYLSKSDLRRLCDSCRLRLSEEDLNATVATMDVDHDLRLSFDEFITFLALTGPGNSVAVRLRAEVASDRAAIGAGAAMGLLPLLKSKVLVVCGTMFYDPMRLFRDTFVDYSTTLRSKLSPISHHDGSLWAVVRAHAKQSHVIGTLLLLSYNVVLDCAVGVTMFLVYSRTKKWMLDRCVVDGAGSVDRLLTKPVCLEAVCGSVGGAAGGFVEQPCRFLAGFGWRHTSEGWRGVRRCMFEGTVFHVLRGAVGHAAFFSAFSWCRAATNRWIFGPTSFIQLDRTSVRDSLTTAFAGCAAGAMYRVVSVPMGNWHHRAARCRASLFRGLGGSLLYTMPVTGVAFLLYEYLLLRL